MIVEAIRAAAQGESFISAELDLALNAGDIGGAPKLSAQERRVMALYGGGEPVKSVAYELGISEETAKSYLKRIREKYRVAGIDVGTKVALRKRAIQDGILIQDAPSWFVLTRSSAAVRVRANAHDRGGVLADRPPRCERDPRSSAT